RSFSVIGVHVTRDGRRGSSERSRQDGQLPAPSFGTPALHGPACTVDPPERAAAFRFPGIDGSPRLLGSDRFAPCVARKARKFPRTRRVHAGCTRAAGPRRGGGRRTGAAAPWAGAAAAGAPDQPCRRLSAAWVDTLAWASTEIPACWRT